MVVGKYACDDINCLLSVTPAVHNSHKTTLLCGVNGLLITLSAHSQSASMYNQQQAKYAYLWHRNFFLE